MKPTNQGYYLRKHIMSEFERAVGKGNSNNSMLSQANGHGQLQHARSRSEASTVHISFYLDVWYQFCWICDFLPKHSVVLPSTVLLAFILAMYETVQSGNNSAAIRRSESVLNTSYNEVAGDLTSGVFLELFEVKKHWCREYYLGFSKKGDSVFIAYGVVII